MAAAAMLDVSRGAGRWRRGGGVGRHGDGQMIDEALPTSSACELCSRTTAQRRVTHGACKPQKQCRAALRRQRGPTRQRRRHRPVIAASPALIPAGARGAGVRCATSCAARASVAAPAARARLHGRVGAGPKRQLAPADPRAPGLRSCRQLVAPAARRCACRLPARVVARRKAAVRCGQHARRPALARGCVAAPQRLGRGASLRAHAAWRRHGPHHAPR